MIFGLLEKMSFSGPDPLLHWSDLISTEFRLDHSTEIRLDALMDRSMEFHDNQLEVRNIFANIGLF